MNRHMGRLKTGIFTSVAHEILTFLPNISLRDMMSCQALQSQLLCISFTFCLNNKIWIQILNGHKEKAKDGNFYLCSKWDSNFLAKCLVKSHDVNRCKVHYACKVMHKLLNGLAGCCLAGRPNDPH